MIITHQNLLAAAGGITTLARHSPATLLALATAWLDPLALDHDIDSVQYDDYDDDPVRFALSVTRHCFPAVYHTAIAQLRTGIPFAVVLEQMASGIDDAGIPVSDCFLDFSLPTYIPLMSAAVQYDTQWLDRHREVLYVIQYIEGEWQPDDDRAYYERDLSKETYDIARTLYWSLQHQPDPRYRDHLACLIIWTFGISGNTLIDCDDEAIWEFTPLEWEPDQVAFAIDMIEEATEMVDHAQHGGDLLRHNLTVNLALLDNIERIRTVIRQKGRFRDELDQHDALYQYYSLDWPALDECAG